MGRANARAFPQSAHRHRSRDPCGAVISALGAYDFIVLFPINPAMLCSYRAAFCASGAKDDRTDAMLLEEYLRLHMAKLRPLEPDNELTRKLAALVENRHGLIP